MNTQWSDEYAQMTIENLSAGLAQAFESQTQNYITR